MGHAFWHIMNHSYFEHRQVFPCFLLRNLVLFKCMWEGMSCLDHMNAATETFHSSTVHPSVGFLCNDSLLAHYDYNDNIMSDYSFED